MNASQEKMQSVQSSVDDNSSASTGSTLTPGWFHAIIFILRLWNLTYLAQLIMLIYRILCMPAICDQN